MVRTPYLASALFGVAVVEVPELGTVAIDQRMRLYVDPVTIVSWSAEVFAGVLIHEVNHVIREHAERCSALGAEPGLWNVAADLEINDDLVQALIPLPAGALHPSGYGFATGQSAEHYYRQLQQQNETSQSAMNPGDLDGDQSQDGSMTADQSESKERPGNEDGKEKGAGDQADGSSDDLGNTPMRMSASEGPPDQEQEQGDRPNGSVARGDCGQGADGQARGFELPDADPMAPGLDKLTVEAIREKVAEEVLKSRGSSPAGLSRWANARGTREVPWQNVLRSRVRRGVSFRTGQIESTYSRPSRRRIPNVLLPAYRRPEASIAIIIDTSGSMSSAELNLAYCEARSLSQQVAGSRVSLIACDAEARLIAEGRLPESIALIGGGGTDMGVGLELVASFQQTPDVVVVITDGYTPWPVDPPERLDSCTFVVLQIGECDSLEVPEWAFRISVTQPVG